MFRFCSTQHTNQEYQVLLAKLWFRAEAELTGDALDQTWLPVFLLFHRLHPILLSLFVSVGLSRLAVQQLSQVGAHCSGNSEYAVHAISDRRNDQRPSQADADKMGGRTIASGVIQGKSRLSFRILIYCELLSHLSQYIK